MENSFDERLNGTLRRQVLDAEWFTNTRQAQVVIGIWFTYHALEMQAPVSENNTIKVPDEWPIRWWLFAISAKLPSHRTVLNQPLTKIVFCNLCISPPQQIRSL